MDVRPRRVETGRPVEYVFLIVALLLNASANLLLKMGANKLEAVSFDTLETTDKLWALGTSWMLILGLLFFASNVLFYTLALKKINVSSAYPIMTSGGFIIISVFSVFYLRESLTGLQIAGIVLIAAGITMVAYHLK